MRREFPARIRAAAFERCNGLCEECRSKLQVGRFHYDHVLPDGLGGKPLLENCRVLCRACHGVKTANQDVPQIAKADRQRSAHLGKPPSRQPLPGGKRSGWKKKLDGTVVRR